MSGEGENSEEELAFKSLAELIEGQLELDAEVKTADNQKYVNFTFDWGTVGTHEKAKLNAHESLNSFKVTLLGDNDKVLATSELDLERQGDLGKNFRVANGTIFFNSVAPVSTKDYNGVWNKSAFEGATKDDEDKPVASQEVVKKVKVEIETKHGFKATKTKKELNLKATE